MVILELMMLLLLLLLFLAYFLLLCLRHWTVRRKTVRPRAPRRIVRPEKNVRDERHTAPRM